MPQEEEKNGFSSSEVVVLKVDMHCEGCKNKVRKSLSGFPGLEGLDINMKEQRVTIKGKIDAKKVYETVKRKSRKKTELLSPLPKKEEPKKEEKTEQKKEAMKEEKTEQKKEAMKEEKTEQKKETMKEEKKEKKKEAMKEEKKEAMKEEKKEEKIEAKKEEEKEVKINEKKDEKEKMKKKKSEPVETTLQFKVKMFSGGCARDLKKAIRNMEGVLDVKTDLFEEKVFVTGRHLNPQKICDRVDRKTGKSMEFIPPSPPKEDKKDEKNKEDEEEEKKKQKKKKEEEERKKKKEEEEEKKEEEKKKAEEESSATTRMEKGKREKEEEDEEVSSREDSVTRKYQYVSQRSIPEHVYEPQLFSDENPNSCSVM